MPLGRTGVRADVALLLVAALVALGFLGSMLHFTGLTVLLPLDDSYIYLRYAEMLASGHPFRYGPVEPPSTGATSPLYVLALLPGALAGLHGDALALWAFLLNALLLVVACLTLLRLLRRIFPERVAVLGALLVATTGVLAYGVLSGMEIGLTIVLFLLAANALAAELPVGKLHWSPLFLSLLALTRPEAMVLSLLAAAALAVSPSSGLRARERWKLAVPFVVAAALAGAYVLMTGRLTPDSSRPKSPLLTPEFDLVFVAQHAAGYLVYVLKAVLPGLQPGASLGTLNLPDSLALVPPFALVLWAMGAVPALADEVARRRPGPHVLLSAWFAFGLVLVAVGSGSGAHHHRYLLPFLVPFVVYLAPGLHAAARVITPSPGRERTVVGILTAALLGWQLLSLVVFGVAYGRDARAFREYRDASLWIRAHLPREARVAALDVGVLGLYSDRRVVDLFGLTTPSLAPANAYFADSMGSRWETLVKLRPEERPTYFLAHAVRFDEHGDEGHLAPFRTRPLRSFGSPPPGFPTVGRDLTLYEIDWASLSPAEDPVVPATVERLGGGRLLDSVNVADVVSEKEHGYRFLADTGGVFQANRLVRAEGAPGRVVADGVRGVLGTERFVLRSSGSGPALLVLRTHAAEGPIAVVVNGSSPKALDLAISGGRWSEPALPLPAGLLHAGANEFAVTGRYASARWWLYEEAPRH